MSGEIKKELYIADPLLKGRLHIAYPMISFMQHPKGQLFLYNFFLNLECSKKEEDLNVCYVSQLNHSDISWIHYLNNHRCYLNFFDEESEGLHVDLQDEINQGNYIYLSFDDFYLPEKMREPRHFEHINMIYGYDQKRRIYKTIGYNSEQRFSLIDLPFSAAEKGVVKTTVETFSPDMGKEFSFSIQHFKMQLDDFIEGRNDLVSKEALAFDGICKENFVYGIKVYDRIAESIEQLGEGRDYDRRTLYMLYEWSGLNYMRIQYLKERHVINFNREIEDMALLNYEEMRKGHYLMLKYSCTYDRRILPKILEILRGHKGRCIHLYTKMRDAL
nr:hypothetical protein [uncultured Acetatifactor sp.]